MLKKFFAFSSEGRLAISRFAFTAQINLKNTGIAWRRKSGPTKNVRLPM